MWLPRDVQRTNSNSVRRGSARVTTTVVAAGIILFVKRNLSRRKPSKSLHSVIIAVGMRGQWSTTLWHAFLMSTHRIAFPRSPVMTLKLVLSKRNTAWAAGRKKHSAYRSALAL